MNKFVVTFNIINELLCLEFSNDKICKPTFSMFLHYVVDILFVHII